MCGSALPGVTPGKQKSAMMDSPRAKDGRAPDVFRPGAWIPMRYYSDEDEVDFAIVGAGPAGMAAASPSAVASRASAIPGATTARLVVCSLEMPMKLFMIPQTVPNRPTKGAVAPIVARIPVVSVSAPFTVRFVTLNAAPFVSFSSRF